MSLFKSFNSKISCSTSIYTHLFRGCTGIFLAVAAFLIRDKSIIATIVLGCGALLAVGGCPMCWTAKLASIIKNKKQSK